MKNKNKNMESVFIYKKINPYIYIGLYKNLKMQEAFNIICTQINLNEIKNLKLTKKQKNVLAKQFLSYFFYNYYTKKDIAIFLNYKTHACVVHNFKTINSYLLYNKQIKILYKKIKSKLKHLNLNK